VITFVKQINHQLSTIIHILRPIHLNPHIPIRQLPGGVKGELCDSSGFVKQDLVDCIGRSVIIVMHTGEIKDRRDAILGKVVVI
jgi:hypothetical protein